MVDDGVHISSTTWTIAALGAAAAALAGAAPTGTNVVDSLIVVAAVMAVVACAATAPWWAPPAVAGVAAAVALQPLGAVIGALGLTIGVAAGARPDGARDAEVRAVVAALALNSLLRSDLGGFFGSSALVGVGASIGLVGSGWAGTSAGLRRIVRRVGVGYGVFCVLAAGLAAVAALALRSDLSVASATGQGAAAALDAGDYERAAELFDTSAERFESVDGTISAPWTWPSRLVPVLAQNVRAGAALADAAERTADVAASSLRAIDPSSLTVSGGAIDLDAVHAVERPLADVQATFAILEAAMSDAQSGWLVEPVQRRLRDVDEEFVQQGPRLDNVVTAVRLLPDLLGGDGERVYLVLFTTPAEARGLGGFAGSYTTVHMLDGGVEVRDVGRIDELNLATQGADCSACAPELLARYGRYGLTTGPGSTTGDATWSNLTMAAHFPYVADAADRLFPQATGQELDGVIVMDPYVVQQFVQYGGPIEVPAFDRVVQPDEVADFILRDQYERADDRAVRLDALEALGTGALASVLAGELPEPATLLADLAQLVSERRLLMWTDRPDEQALFDAIGLSGALPTIDPADAGFSVSVTNASGSKIDVFLERRVAVTEAVGETDLDAGRRVLRAEVELTNGAPSDGLPAYVIGNRIGLPSGTSRLFVTFYGSRGLSRATLDGERVDLERLPEAGWEAYGHFVEFEPGQTRRYVLDFVLPDSAGEWSPTRWEQPLATRTPT